MYNKDYHRGRKETDQDLSVDKLKNKIAGVRSFSEIRVSEFATPDSELSAEKIAKEFNMRMHQLRKFFEKLKQLENKIRFKKDNEELEQEIKDELSLLVAHAYYSVNRNFADESFAEIVKVSCEKIKTVLDLKRFVQFFTCILAYMREGGRKG